MPLRRTEDQIHILLEWLQKFIPKIWIYLVINNPPTTILYRCTSYTFRIMSYGVSNTTISFLNVFYSCLSTNSDIFLLEQSTICFKIIHIVIIKNFVIEVYKHLVFFMTTKIILCNSFWIPIINTHFSTFWFQFVRLPF